MKGHSEGQPEFFCITDMGEPTEEEDIDAYRNYLKTTGPESITEELSIERVIKLSHLECLLTYLVIRQLHSMIQSI